MDELDALTTEARNPDSEALDRMSALAFVELMNREEQKAVAAVAEAAPRIAAAIEAVAERMARGGRLVYCGAGTSGRLGLVDASECPPTFRVPEGRVVALLAGGPDAFRRAVEGAEDDPGQGAADLDGIRFGPDDTLVGIAASGRTPYVLGALRHAREIGGLTIGLSCNRGSDVERLAELPITVVVGPEVLTGSTRLKAGTATKLVLNALSTGVMVRLGKVYGNLMVDLEASNHKLRVRSRRIVMAATGLSTEAATELLARAGGEVKTAIVVHVLAVAPEVARARLAAAHGRVRDALEVEA